MLSNFSSINMVNKKYTSEEISIYKDTVKAMLKIKEDINQLKNHNNSENNVNSESDVITLQDQNTITNIQNSFEESLILLNIMKKELEKNILKKYNIENLKDIHDNIDIINKNDNNNIVNNNNQNNHKSFIKKNFKSI